jgi:predicted DCC family thiol-disulfide oxidoreductase YuxK
MVESAVTPTVIYDADCRFCETSRQWLARWDRRGRLHVLHYEQPEALRLQPDLEGIGCLEAFRFVNEEGRVWEGERAAVEIVKRLPGGRSVAWLLSLPGIYWLTARGYQWIAAHRYQWFGRTVR